MNRKNEITPLSGEVISDLKKRIRFQQHVIVVLLAVVYILAILK